MTTTTQPGNRAHFLAGLRTGGVRSVSVPHTAGPQASFVVPQPQHQHVHYQSSFPEEDEMDQLSQMMNHNVNISQRRFEYQNQVPRTANCDMNGAPMQYQQQQQWNNVRQQPQQQNGYQMYNGEHPMTAHGGNAQELQLQMMQMELMRLQALSQLQQFSQYRHDGQQIPQTAYQSNIGSGYPGQNAPMTAAIGGKFNRRPSLNPSFEEEVASYQSTGLNNRVSSVNVDRQILKDNGSIANSKSDSAISWRNATASKGESLANQRRSPLPRRPRPEPLELKSVSNIVHETDSPVSREASDSSNDSSSTKSDGEQISSTPTTPVSGGSNGSLSGAREEASKKLFQGLGLGRPSIHVTAPSDSNVANVAANILGDNSTPNNNIKPAANRVVSQPIRQPRGPPASAEEFKSKNFANRIRKQAIGGLGALLEARERREVPAGVTFTITESA